MSPSERAIRYANVATSQMSLPKSIAVDVSMFAAELWDYGGRRAVRRYLALIVKSASAVGDLTSAQGGEFISAVARSFFKVLAYKDEYEVARLHLKEQVRRDLKSEIGPAHVYYHLHPPFLRAMGLKHKIALPSWLAIPLFKILCAARRLRSTPFDPFGRTRMRRRERHLIADYERAIGEVAPTFDGSPVRAIAVATLPESVRGYESIKEGALDAFYSQLEVLLQPAIPNHLSAERAHDGGAAR